MTSDVQTIATLAVECWKVLRALDRAAELVPDSAKPRLQAQARYSAGRLDAILAGRGMSVISFDGRSYEMNLPVSAVNADDFSGEEALIIERTLEPAVVADMVPVVTAKVYLARSKSNVSRD